MATHPRLVNKQFNTPINLYSQKNIQDVMDRETQILSNGAVGWVSQSFVVAVDIQGRSNIKFTVYC